MKDNKPENFRFPKIASWIFRKLISSEDRLYFLHEIRKEYTEHLRDRGIIRAYLWYWVQLFRSIPSFFSCSVERSLSMFRNYFRVAIRNLFRERAFSLINISGLALGMSVFILILLYVQYELSYDRYHDNPDNIYRIIWHQPGNDYMGSDYFAQTQAKLAPTLIQEFPEVISAARMQNIDDVLISYENSNFLEDDFGYADPEIFDIFSLELIKGDPEHALDDPNSVIISQRMAEKYFGDGDPVGKILTFDNNNDIIVTGILKDMPGNSHFRFEFILPFQSFLTSRNIDESRWFPSWTCYSYCLFETNTDIKDFEAKLAGLLEKNNVRIVFDDLSRLALQPMTSIHLHSHINFEISQNGDIKYVYIFISVGGLILVIACLNYINLATARSVKRNREVGIRKVVGAKKGQLFRQFFGETILLSVFSLILSLIIVAVVLPEFNSLIDRVLSLSFAENSQLILVLSALVIIVGLFAGIYPALNISSLRTIAVLKNIKAISPGGIFVRNILVLSQFTISVILIIGSLIIKDQLEYIRNKDLGYNKDRILIVTINDRSITRSAQLIKNEFMKNSDVLRVSTSSHLPNRITSFDSYNKPGEVINSVTEPGLNFKNMLNIYNGYVDHDFIEVYGIELIDGRNFSEEISSDRNSILINESVAREFELSSPLGLGFERRNRNEKIIGVVKDFHFQSLHNKIAPLILYLRSASARYISVKIKGNNIPGTIETLESTMKEFSSEYPFEYSFFDEVFDRVYRSEQKLGKFINIITFLAIFIACLGLLGLSSFITEQRTKEIAVRKVLGAKVTTIVTLLSREFMKWIVVSSVIAWPIGYIIMNLWLQNFAYRADINILLFFVSAGIALLISVLTISFQSIKAAVANPVDSLRCE